MCNFELIIGVRLIREGVDGWIYTLALLSSKCVLKWIITGNVRPFVFVPNSDSPTWAMRGVQKGIWALNDVGNGTLALYGSGGNLGPV